MTDIPLSYISKEDSPSSIKSAIDEAFSIDSANYINPFDTFDRDDILLFDDNNNVVANMLHRSRSNEYMYYPKSAVEFTPSEFYADIVIKKRLEYDSSRKYNIKICVNETDDELTWSKKLISIFGNAYKKGLCPTSITVNNGATDPISLINSSYANNDFVFIKTINGKDISTTESIDIDAILGYHSNIWITMPAPEAADAEAGLTYKAVSENMSMPCIYSTNSATVVDESSVNPDADDYMDTIEEKYSDYDFDYTYIRFGVVIGHKDKHGYIIFSYSNFLDTLSDNVKVIYDILMYIYLKSYVIVSTNTVFITNSPIDYYMSINKPFKLTHPVLNLDELLKNDNVLIDTYDFISVSTDNIDVIFNRLDSSNNLIFMKIGGTDDPVKQDNEVSLYTTKRTVIHYNNEQKIKLVESAAIINYTINEVNDVFVSVNPLYSSSNKIRSNAIVSLKVKNIEVPNYLIALPVDENNVSYISLIPATEYVPGSGILIATIKVVYSSDNAASDIRILGGGLTYDSEDDYELMDIGSIEGRPYRIGTTGIVKLPKRLSKYEDIIQDSIDKHCVATDRIIIKYY